MRPSWPAARRAARVYDEDELAAVHGGHWVILTGCRKGTVPAALGAAAQRPSGRPCRALRELRRLAGVFGAGNVRVELTVGDQPTDDERNDALAGLAAAAGVPTVATSNVHYATPREAKLAQALTAIRARSSLTEMDGWLAAAGGGYLRSGDEAARRLSRYPGVVERTLDLAAACAFDFHVIAPRLPDFPVPGGGTEASTCAAWCWRRPWAGTAPRRPSGSTAPTRRSPASWTSSRSSPFPATS